MCESFNCLEIAKENEKQIKIQQEAQQLANETGEWFAIYKEDGQFKYIRADQAAGLPVIGYASPKLRNPNV